MELTTINQLIAAGSGLAGALVGATISGLANYRLEHSKRNYEAKALLAGFVSEIISLRDIIIFRGYMTGLSELLDLTIIKNGGVYQYKVNIPSNYARFYDANLGKIGLIPSIKLMKIMQFHQIIFAISQDFKPDSPLYQFGYDKRAIEETLAGLNSAMHLADEIADWKVD
jgi:hypothetical protein